MDATGKRRHVFISHHHADDVEVSKMSDLLTKSGYDIRNSSIRAKPANQRRLERGLVKDETIRRLLRMKSIFRALHSSCSRRERYAQASVG